MNSSAAAPRSLTYGPCCAGAAQSACIPGLPRLPAGTRAGVTLVLLKTLHGISLLVSGVVGGLLRECAWHPGHLAVAWHSPGITRCCLGLWGIRGLGLDGLVLGCGGLRILHHRARELRTGHHSCRNLSSGKTAGLGLACALHLAGHHAVRHLPWVRSGSVGLLRISGLSRGRFQPDTSPRPRDPLGFAWVPPRARSRCVRPLHVKQRARVRLRVWGRRLRSRLSRRPGCPPRLSRRRRFQHTAGPWAGPRRASDIALLLSVGACDAELECALFISDARSLIGKADGVAVIQDGDDGF